MNFYDKVKMDMQNMDPFRKIRAEELLKRAAQIKIHNVDYNMKGLEGLAEFIKDFKLYTTATKDIEQGKIENDLRDVNQEMQGVKLHAESLKRHLKESGVISRIEIHDDRFDEENAVYNWGAYNTTVVLPATKKCMEMTWGKNFEQELDNQIQSFKDDIYQIELEIVEFEKQINNLKLQKQTLGIFKDTKKRSELSKKISKLKVYVERDKQTLDRLNGGLEVLETQQERILQIAPEDRKMIEQFIGESNYLNAELERRQDKLLEQSDWLRTKTYPYSILSFFKFFPNATKHIGTLRNLAIYLEESGISNRDINGYETFPVEKFVDFSPCEKEMEILIHELNDEVFRKTLSLQPLPEKAEPYSWEDYLRDNDIE